MAPQFIFKRWILLSIYILSFNYVIAQIPKEVKEFSPGKIENVTVDRLGNFFLTFKNGSIKKYDPNGKILASLNREASTTLLEPWFHPKIFAYHRDQQRYVFYDHNFKEPLEGK